MHESDDIKFMTRCIDLARCAEGMTYPNPLVGSVIVHNGVIIGEGCHMRAGEAHAEVEAINSVKKKNLLGESTLYVNLEPCSHFGRTPPCADRIVNEGIKRIVIGCADTSAKVSGRGIARLREAGREVIAGVLEEESRWLNRRFFTFHEKSRPYIILKWAESSDGFIDIEREEGVNIEPTWITGKSERVLVHRWRAGEQAILAGGKTLRADNPQLNVRLWKGHDPLRLILTASGLADGDLKVFNDNGTNIVFTFNENISFNNSELVVLERDISSAHQVVLFLFGKGIQSLIVEGGTDTINHFVDEGLWDEARIFTGSTSFGGGVRAPARKGRHLRAEKFGNSTLDLYVNEYQ